MLPFLAALAIQVPDVVTPAPAPARWTTAELEAVSREIQGQIEELRGQKFREPVAVKVADKKGFIDYALQRQKETESPAKAVRDETVAKLLGLLPPAMDLQAEMLELLREQVGGFYDPATKTFYLMDTFTGGLARIILAHELTHALDDQYYDIDGGLKKCGDDTDAQLAYQSLVEGSGQRAMTQWTLAHRSALSPDEITKAGSMGADQLRKAPPYLWKPLLTAYMKGDAFLSKGSTTLRRAAKDAGTDAELGKEPCVRAAFQAPPVSSEQVLHPDKYWSKDARDLPVQVRIATDRLPEGWAVLGTDTLGESFLSLLTTPRADRTGIDPSNVMALLSIRYTNTAAEGWGGDRLVLLGRGDDRVLLLVTVWDTDKDADEFAAALVGSGGGQVPSVISTWKPGADDKVAFVPKFTPTSALVTRGTAAGESAVVIVRVGSFARPDAAESRLDTFLLPHTIERAAK